MKQNFLIIAFLATLLVALALAIGPGQAVRADDGTPTDTPTDTLTPTYTPTDTLVPSNTPIPTDTLTTVPIDTPIATNTPSFAVAPTMTYGDVFIINAIVITTVILVILLVAIITLDILYHRRGHE